VSAPLEEALVTRLVTAAREARERAHAPYSGFKVGSALLTRSGELFTGCNVENASYGLCCCAERIALFAAIAAGCQPFAAAQPPVQIAHQITHLAVIADTDAPVSPCGACRQVMIELGGPDLIVIQANMRGSVAATTAAALLPGAFAL
jgi:cytidine deaminase